MSKAKLTTEEFIIRARNAHGDIFHGNPDLFEEHEQCHAFNDLTAKELYNKTKERENKIISLGYNLVVIWENDFNYV